MALATVGGERYDCSFEYFINHGGNMIKKKFLSFFMAVTTLFGAFAPTACAGFGDEYVELPHYDTLDGTYDTELMYRNLLKINNGDPGGLWVSKEDDPVYGGYCYVALATLNNRLSKEDYPDYRMAGFEIYRSSDLSNWEACGAIDGSGLGIESGSWIDTWTWAPELFRDAKTGMYFMYFSARAKSSVISGGDNDRHCLAIAMSKTPFGPYEIVTSEEYYTLLAGEDSSIVDGKLLDGAGQVVTTVNAENQIENLNGDVITKNTPTVNFNSQSARKHIIETVEELGTFPCIDASFFQAENGDMYMYFDSHLNSWKESISNKNNADPNYNGVYKEDYSWQYNNNEIWGMKMKDLITPDYSTLQIMATPRYKSVRAKEITVEENGESVRKVSLDPRNFTRTDEFYEIGEGNNVNEGAHMIEKDGKFYLTYSPTGTGNILYSICQAVSDSPLGPFKKLPECNPVIGLNDTNDYMSCTGHHSFVYIEDEIFALYHCFWQELSASGGRCLAVDRVKFMYNETLGHDVLYGMGPTQAVQPANKAHTGLENVAQTAKISVSTSGKKESVKYLTDGFFPSQEFAKDWEFTAKGAVTITLEWDKPQEISALFIYNAYSYYNAFDKVDWIKFELSQSPDWSNQEFSRAVIQNLKCNPNNVNENELCMRQGGGAVASFNPLKVTKLTIQISSKYTTEFEDGSLGENKGINVSELYVMGKEV